jgi:xylulokinase
LRTTTSVQELHNKLGDPVASFTPLGCISQAMVDRFGFDSNCQVFPGSGDNPNSLAGCCLQQGDICISMGTSDTVFARTTEASPSVEGHVFCDPISPNGYMPLNCYSNGSLVREQLRYVRLATLFYSIFCT